MSFRSAIAEWLAPKPTPLLPDIQAGSEKATFGAGVAMFNMGYPLMSDMRASPQKKMQRAQMAYHTNGWIKSAENTVTRRVVGLDWHLEDQNEEEIDNPQGDVLSLRDLLERPQKNLPDRRQMTRRELLSITSRHMGLTGMAYWYLDGRGAFGPVTALIYVNPARVWPSADARGNLVGWILDAKDDQGNGGTPLTLQELLPFYLEPPDWGHLGSGLYEAVALKAQVTNLADQHAAYVLGTGGRIPGIISPKEGTIPPETFQRLVAEFRNVNEAPDAAKRTTILDGPIDFTKTAADPSELALLDLSKMNRDDIYAIWGVPPSQAGVVQQHGGLNSGLTKGFDEAILMQGAVHDRVAAIYETLQYGLLDPWFGGSVELVIEEPEFDDRSPLFDMATKVVALPLTSAERRDIIGLPPFGDERDDEIWLPATQTQVYPPPAPTAPPVGPLGAPPALGPVAPDGTAVEPISNDEADILGDALIETGSAKAGPAYVFGRKNPNFVKEAARVASKDQMLSQLHKLYAAGKHGSQEYRDLVKQFHATETKAERSARLQKFVDHLKSLQAKGIKKGPATGKPISELIARASKYLAGVRAAPAKARGLRKSVDERWMPAIRAAMADVLRAQMKDVAAKLRGVSDEEFKRQAKNAGHWWSDRRETDRLSRVISPRLASIAEVVSADLIAPRKAKASVSDIVARILERAGIRIRGINDTTREAVAQAIAEGYELGLTANEMADRIEGLPAFDEARAELVARTESALAYNEATVESYRELGTGRVEVLDGDSDEVCAAAHGQIWTLDEALADPLGHPNCIRDFAPVAA